MPPEQRGLTVADPEAILTEFSARETLDHFATPWWRDLRRAANLFALDILATEATPLSRTPALMKAPRTASAR